MQKQKVAIVLDNQLEISKKIIADLGEKHSEIEVFDFSEFNNQKLNFWNLNRLIWKIEDLDLSEFDLVYTLSTGFANGIVTNLSTKHINIVLSWPNWYYQTNKSFLKLRLRSWMDLAIKRPEETFELFEGVLGRISVGQKPYKKLASSSLNVVEEPQDHYLCFVTENGKFLEEVARAFNHTSKKVLIVADKDVISGFDGFSKNVQWASPGSIDFRVKGMLFDQYYNDFDYLLQNLDYSVPCLVYRNKLLSKFLGEKAIYSLNDIDSFENEIAKFVSWVKINKSTLSLPKI